ncbi:hypothetical protein [Bradyrhizobium sp.]|uniref:hypothetical protein n=1 Tax=Bradyrhizobium sp. TaxID=376 RepID=UPI0025C73B05|nr:hypothetical protein [Bradyrhizobium sp.]
MRVLGGIFGVMATVGLLAGPAAAQGGPTRYGEPDKVKTPSEIAAEKEAERAYQRSLGNIPERQKASDPWGTVRSEGAPPKAAATAPPSRPKTKSADTKPESGAK